MKKFKFTKSNVKIIIICAAAVIAVAAMILVMRHIENSEYSVEDHLHNAELFMGLGEYENAVSAYKEAIKLDSDNIDAYVGEAEAYLGIGGTANAVDLYAKAIELIAKEYNKSGSLYEGAKDVYYACADVYVEAGDAQSAYNTLKGGTDIIDGIVQDYSQYEAIQSFVVPEEEPATEDDTVSTQPLETNEQGDLLFGSYPQNEVAGDSLTDAITKAAYDESDSAVVDGVRYKRVKSGESYRYFRYESIAWQIVQETSESYIVMSVYALDSQMFNEAATEVNWETCSLRQWLMNDFYNEAFTKAEQGRMIVMQVEQVGNTIYSTTVGAGATLSDFISLVNINEICTGGKYNGFELNMNAEDGNRVTSPTAYAAARGIYIDSTGNCRWWLRTPGSNLLQAMYVNTNGVISADGYFVNGTGFGVRPIISLPKNIK